MCIRDRELVDPHVVVLGAVLAPRRDADAGIVRLDLELGRQVLALPPLRDRAAVAAAMQDGGMRGVDFTFQCLQPVSYTHLRAHETVLDLVCRLLLEKKKQIHNETALYK